MTTRVIALAVFALLVLGLFLVPAADPVRLAATQAGELLDELAFAAGARVPRRIDVKITELFYSLQGEGILSGMPSVFIRLAGCNLRCGWCDTKYASWYPESEPWSLDAVTRLKRRQ